MRARSDLPPETLSVTLDPEGVGVEYRDGRETFYHGVPDPVGGPVRTGPDRQVHVLVTDPGGREGVMTYVNDRATHDDVLEQTGVGRVILEAGERGVLYPGVEVRMDGMVPVIEADPAAVDGRVFVFEENELGERSYELVADDREGADESNGRDGGEA
jgi:hypothetical protein